MNTEVNQQVEVKTMIKKQNRFKAFNEHRDSYIMVAPFLIIFTVFTVFPVILSFILSFTYYNVLEFPKWIGWNNYVRLFTDDDIFLIAVKNTFVFAGITGPVGYMMCLFFAWTVNELPPKLRAFLSLVLYAPSLAGAIAIWALVFKADMYGYLNSFLLSIKAIKDPIAWLNTVAYMMPIAIMVQLWSSIGVSFLTLRAGFNTIDRSYYEAAAVDGLKNRWQELWFITLPMMAPHLVLAAVLAITGAFGAGGMITSLFGFPSASYAVHTVMHHLSDYGGIRYERGYASAIATLLFLAMVLSNKYIQSKIRKIGA
jgi:multiple sugar transport system permease protein